jgi:hypothetical protein
MITTWLLFRLCFCLDFAFAFAFDFARREDPSAGEGESAAPIAST